MILGAAAQGPSNRTEIGYARVALRWPLNANFDDWRVRLSSRARRTRDSVKLSERTRAGSRRAICERNDQNWLYVIL